MLRIDRLERVAGAVEAFLVEGLGGLLRRVPVTRHHVRPAEARFQLVADRHQLDLAARRRHADVARRIAGAVGKGARRRAFGHAQTGEHADALAAMRLGDALQAVPHFLRQRRGGEEEHAHARQERLAQRRILFQRLRQLFPAARHAQVYGGRDLAQVAQGLLEQRRGRLAVVEVEAAAVVQGDADVVAAAEGVVPRQPVDQHRRLPEHREGLQQHLLVRAQHALGGDHRLGQQGGAGGEQELGDAVRAAGGEGGIGGVQRTRHQQIVETQAGTIAHGTAHAHRRDIGGEHRCDRRGERSAVAGEQQARTQHLGHMPQLGEIARQQRIARRHRAVRDAGVHRRERQLQVFQIVAGQDRQRPLRRQAHVQQMRGDAAGALEHLRVAQAPPLPGVVALRHEGGIRGVQRPVLQALQQVPGQRRQRFARAQAQHAVGIAVDLGIRVAQSDRTVARGGGNGLSGIHRNHPGERDGTACGNAAAAPAGPQATRRVSACRSADRA
ncbi:hypothetical protein NB689_002093 [Xanthomonas sacchari]|nr:hypothetical protein [Xanthomonas sacchari]